MTAERHNKILGTLHLVYGGFTALMMLAMSVFFYFMFRAIGNSPTNPGEPPLALFMGIMAFVLIFWLLLIIPSFIAGYGLLKRKPWARTAGIIASILAVINFPHGTALGVYSLWFLFGEHGQRFYDKAGLQSGVYGSLYGTPPPPPVDWNTPAQTQSRQRDHLPPPDWR